MAEHARIASSTWQFLSDLAAHNDRDWFQANKAYYQRAHANMCGVADALLSRMRLHDNLSNANGKACLMRIHNDLRFHKNKPPYKDRFAGGFDRVKPALRGGYFFHLQPGASFLGVGLFAPVADDLRTLRTDILYDADTWRGVLATPPLKKVWGDLHGNALRSAPRGVPKDHPDIDLLRYTQFLHTRALPDKEVLAPDMVERVDGYFRAIRPWFDHLSTVLTSDGDGVPK